MAYPRNPAASSILASRRLFFLYSSLFLLLAAVSTVATSQQQQEESRELTPNQSIEREIAGGETHSYRVTLAAGQFLRAVLNQRGVNVFTTLFDPTGKKLAELDGPFGAQGPEPISLLAETAGTYHVTVQPWKPNLPRGSYEIKIEEVRMAQPRDKDRIAAEWAFAAATRTGLETAEMSREAMAKYQQVIPLWQRLGDRAQEAKTLTIIGLIHRTLGDYQQALDHYRRALSLQQAIGDRRGEAMTLYQLGWVHNNLGESQKSLDFYRQAQARWQELGDLAMEASTLGNLGVLHSGLGEQEKALDYFNRALAIKRAVRDPNGEATLLNNIGLVQSYLGERQQALDSYQRSLPLERTLGNRMAESRTLHNIAMLYEELGEPHKALLMLEEALQIRRAIGVKLEEAFALNSIGVVYDNLKEYQKALEYYEQARSLSHAAGARSLEATTLTHLGQTHSSLGEQQKALTFYQQALAIQREIGERRSEALTLAHLGRTYHALREHERARDCYQQALPLHQAVSDRSGEAFTRSHLARLLRDLNQLAEARAQTTAALTLVETLRSKVASQELRSSYLASVQSYYELGIDLLMQLHQQKPSEDFAAAALQTSERAHARSLLELLTEARADLRQGVASALLERERALQFQLDTKAAAQTRLLNGKHTAEQATTAAKEISTLTTEFEQVQAQIRHTSPRYAALTQPAPLSLKEIQTSLLDKDTLLLEYALGEERSWLWAVTPTSLHSYELPKRAEIEAAAHRVYAALTARNQTPANETPEQRRRRLDQADAEFPKAAAALSQTLLAPIAAQLSNKRLLIVGDGVLQYIPFAALPVVGSRLSVIGKKNADNRQLTTDNRQPLIVNHEIINLPSASALAVLRQEAAARKPATKTLAVLADPVFQRDDPRFQPANATRAGEMEFVRLRFSRAEADAIAALAPAAQTMKALDFAANRETATSAALGDYRLVHFATHAQLNAEHPELSGIVLSQVNEQGEPRNGWLRLHEIYNLRLGAELVVLSACETALGKEVKGEGLIGLTRGFMYAGAPRIAASLWRTDDRAAAELMKRFYQRMLSEKLSPAAALRAAQVSLLREPRWQTPYFWAAFTLQGEWK